MLDRVGVQEHLGRTLPKDLPVQRQDGKKLSFAQLLSEGGPVIFTFAYYRCPVLCSMVLDATARAYAGLSPALRSRTKLVTLSIDPTDTSASATRKRKEVLGHMGEAAGAARWDFLTAKPPVIKAMTSTAGFRYVYEEKMKQYGHSAVVFILSPDGKIARYLYGISFESKDLELALLEAQEGKVSSAREKLLLYCFRYDAHAGRYVLVATRVMQLAGLLTVLILGLALFLWWRRDLRNQRATSARNARASALPEEPSPAGH